MSITEEDRLDLESFERVVGGDFAHLRGEFEGLRGDFAQLRGEFTSLQSDFESLRATLKPASPWSTLGSRTRCQDRGPPGRDPVQHRGQRRRAVRRDASRVAEIARNAAHQAWVSVAGSFGSMVALSALILGFG